MRLPSKELQIAYFQALDGNITYDGAVVPVFDVVPHNEEYPYIMLGSQSINEAVTKTHTTLSQTTFEFEI